MDKNTIERDILGNVLVHFDLVDKFLAQLKESDFSDIRHKYMYKLFQKLVQTNVTEFNFSDVSSTYPKAIDLCGGITYICELISDCITTANFDYNCKALIKQSTISTLQKLSDNAEGLFREDFDKGMAFVEHTMEELVDRVHKTESVNLYQSFKDAMSASDMSNIDFKFKSLHDIMGYPHPGELLIIGARPGMGKTAFALACLFNYICCEKKKAVMFSLEMSGTELFQRMISSISAIPLQDIRAGKLTDEMKKCLDDNAKELASNKFLSLYDKTVSNIPALRAAIRKEQKKGDVGLVIVDYLQLLSGNGNNNYEKVSEISRQLKLLAREFNCCVVALSQLSRKVEDRSDKRPQLSDLRESGAIEQDADYVMFLYRHNYYAKDPNVDPKKEPLNIEIAKNRHGKIGTVQLTFDLTTGRFVV
jgi:replicative DNA helicase